MQPFTKGMEILKKIGGYRETLVVGAYTPTIMCPVATAVQIGLLVFAPTGSKMCIHQHVLSSQPPGCWQSAERFLGDHEHSDIIQLEQPLRLLRLVHRDLLQMKHVIQWAIRGMQCLASWYENPTLKTEKHFQRGRMVANVLHLFTLQLQGKILETDPPPAQADMSVAESAVLDFFNTFWTEAEISAVCSVMTLAEEATAGPHRDSLIQAVQSILAPKLQRMQTHHF